MATLVSLVPLLADSAIVNHMKTDINWKHNCFSSDLDGDDQPDGSMAGFDSMIDDTLIGGY